VFNDSDLLWSDPHEVENPPDESDEDAEAANGDQSTRWYGYNETRQCSYVYGYVIDIILIAIS